MQGKRVHITQGEKLASADPEAVISTILGSCVSCCLWDPIAKVGGMNHMLLTVSTVESGICNLAGINAMELLINDILKLGGQRHRLRAKAFGGARMVSGLSDIGKTNSEFTLGFLRAEGIECEGHSLGGEAARHVMFWPATGRVMQKVRKDAPVELRAEVTAPETGGNDLELF
ncbi:chemotaxis protein CheD [uncultured Roseobacter sp.]|uniref:chemotaxis protein CheD n=1 Tax=uncultured Roseobacter sp. TaxID=114847 RepID=UPI002612D5B0|nr:chemotaxis protein CheD [uncultured Roseobacter sp.]